MNIQPKITPVLDPGFVPAVLWNQAFEAKAAADPASHQVDIALTRNDGTCFRWSGKLLPHTGENVALNETYVERIVKFLLWQKGGNIILVAGDDAIADMLASRYCKGGAREFDWDFIGKKIYGSPIEVKKVSVEELPEEYSGSMTLGRNLDGYRIGFDLGGSDRKCAAVVNGEVVYSEEVVWDAPQPTFRGWTPSAVPPPASSSTARCAPPPCSAASARKTLKRPSARCSAPSRRKSGTTSPLKW